MGYCWTRKYGGLRDGYYIGAQCAIIVFDLTNKSSYEHIAEWYGRLRHTCENIPIVLVGSKTDIVILEVVIETINFHFKHGLKYFQLVQNQTINSRNFFYR